MRGHAALLWGHPFLHPFVPAGLFATPVLAPLVAVRAGTVSASSVLGSVPTAALRAGIAGGPPAHLHAWAQSFLCVPSAPTRTVPEAIISLLAPHRPPCRHTLPPTVLSPHSSQGHLLKMESNYISPLLKTLHGSLLLSEKTPPPFRPSVITGCGWNSSPCPSLTLLQPRHLLLRFLRTPGAFPP